MHASIIVQGLVQGVGFRSFVYGTATRMGLTGHVSNMPDGTVQVIAEGDKGLLSDLIKELKIGPIGSEVTAVDVKWSEEEEGYNDFGLEY
ncbi:MAG TPA: acylphosphatase [bacterium]